MEPAIAQHEPRPPGDYGRPLAPAYRRSPAVPVAAASVLGAIAGAVLLLSLPASAFRAIVPAFIVIALILIVAQNRLTRALAAR